MTQDQHSRDEVTMLAAAMSVRNRRTRNGRKTMVTCIAGGAVVLALGVALYVALVRPKGGDASAPLSPMERKSPNNKTDKDESPAKATAPPPSKAPTETATSQSQQAGRAEVFHFQPTNRLELPPGLISEKIEVRPNGVGRCSIKVLEGGHMAFYGTEIVPDALGSTNIHIIVEPGAGPTSFAGLDFRTDCILNIWKDGSIEVDKEGIEASDNLGSHYVSQEVTQDGKTSILMMRRREGPDRQGDTSLLAKQEGSDTREATSAREKVVTNSIGMKLVLIPAGEFLMGSPDSVRDAPPCERPQHRVRITKSFYLGMHEVTQEQYERVMGKSPIASKGDPQKPVHRVSWNDSVEFCRRLSDKEGMTYRLPTEAEWEYTCRAGTTTLYSFGDDPKDLGGYAWWMGTDPRNAGVVTIDMHPVGQKKPNAWGLYDMHGNVSEWCADWYATDYYAKSPVDDPVGPDSGDSRVLRGGSDGDSHPGSLRSAYRLGERPSDALSFFGLRVARSETKQTAASKPERLEEDVERPHGHVPIAGPPAAVQQRFKLVSSEVSLGKVREGSLTNTFTVSPDSKHVAYIVQSGNKGFVVVDGLVGEEYGGFLKGIVFSPNSERVAYVAKRAANGSLLWTERSTRNMTTSRSRFSVPTAIV